jgi:hypothetical protein
LILQLVISIILIMPVSLSITKHKWQSY